MKKCQDIERLLSLYAEGILTDAEKQAVSEHLTDCAACRKELTYLEKAGQLVDRLSPVEAPPWFEQKIMARVRKEAEKKNSARKWFYPLRFKIPLQIAATLVIAVLAVYIYRSGDVQVKAILPGAPKAVEEVKKEQQPAQMPQREEKVLRSRKPEQKAALRKEMKEDKQATGGGVASDALPKPEVPQSKSVVSEIDTFRAKGLAESKDKAIESLKAEQNEAAAARAPMADQERKAADQALPALAKKRESYKMAAPAAPQSMEKAAVAAPRAGVSIRVRDPQAASGDIFKLLARYKAQNILTTPAENAVVIRAEISGRNWQTVLAELKAMGKVQEKTASADAGEHAVSITIEITGQ